MRLRARESTPERYTSAEQNYGVPAPPMFMQFLVAENVGIRPRPEGSAPGATGVKAETVLALTPPAGRAAMTAPRETRQVTSNKPFNASHISTGRQLWQDEMVFPPGVYGVTLPRKKFAWPSAADPPSSANGLFGRATLRHATASLARGRRHCGAGTSRGERAGPQLDHQA